MGTDYVLVNERKKQTLVLNRGYFLRDYLKDEEVKAGLKSISKKDVLECFSQYLKEAAETDEDYNEVDLMSCCYLNTMCWLMTGCKGRAILMDEYTYYELVKDLPEGTYEETEPDI